MTTPNTPRLAAIAALALVALPLLGTPATAAGNCTLGLTPRLACATADSATAVSCSVAAGAFSCSFSATRSAHGWTPTMLPAEVQAGVIVMVGVCDDNGCDQAAYFPNGACAWSVGGHGCTVGDTLTASRSGSYTGCLVAWVEQEVRATVYTSPRAPLLPTNLALHEATTRADFDSCA